jgi:hypothetical protein
VEPFEVYIWAGISKTYKPIKNVQKARVQRQGGRMKLTKAQLACLKELSKEGACAYYMPSLGRYSNQYWYLSTTYEKVTKQIPFLVKHGFVNVKFANIYRDNGIATITGKGKVYVELA